MNYKMARKQLEEGETIKVRPHGNSMTPIIISGQEITISPDHKEYGKGDVVFCKVKGNYYVHLISSTKNGQYQISNNHGRVNGWISKNSIYGKVIL